MNMFSWYEIQGLHCGESLIGFSYEKSIMNGQNRICTE